MIVATFGVSSHYTCWLNANYGDSAYYRWSFESPTFYSVSVVFFALCHLVFSFSSRFCLYGDSVRTVAPKPA